MAQEVPVAGLAGPVAVGDGGVTTALGALAEGSKQLQTNRLAKRSQEAVDLAGSVADRTRQQLESTGGAFAQVTEAGESAALLSTAEGSTTEELLSRTGVEVGERANRVFGRYRDALRQGATNATAARISVEKEMQSLISMNPAYADVIRQEAARAMGQSEFNLLIRDRENLPAGGANTSQFEKDLASVYDAVDAMPSWSPEYKEARKRQLQEDLSNKYMIQNTNDWYSATSTQDANLGEAKAGNISREISLRANEILGTGLDLIASNGGLADDGNLPMLGEEQLAQLSVTIESQMRDYRLRLEQTLPTNMDPKQRQEQINAYLAPLASVEDSLRKRSASQVLGLMYEAQQAGTKLSMSKAFPLYTAIHETFGENAQYFLKMFGDDPLSSLSFQNSAYVTDLRDKVNNGLIQREQIPSMLIDYVGTNLRAAESGGQTDWNFLNQSYVAPAAATVPVADRNNDDQYMSTVQTMSANSPQELSKTIAGTQRLDKAQTQAVGVWKTAVDGLAAQTKQDLARDNSVAPDNRQSYVAATVNPDGRLSLVKYTAVLGGDGKWRVNGGVPVRGLTNGVSNLTTRYGVGNGSARSIVEHPGFVDTFYGQSSEEYLGGLLSDVNNIPMPEWLPSTAKRSMASLVGDFSGDVVESTDEAGGTTQTVTPTPPEIITEVQAAMDKDPSEMTDYEALVVQMAQSSEFDGMNDEERVRAAADVLHRMRQRR